MLWAYAVACLETVLKHSEKVGDIYLEIVYRCWNSPGCQAVINEAIKQHYKDWETRSYRAKVINAIDHKNPIPPWPETWASTAEEHKENADFIYLISRIHDFILRGFNRSEDLANEAPKVKTDSAPFLVAAITFRSMVDYCEIEPSYWNTYQTLRAGKDTYNLQRIMSENPSIRLERRIKRNIIKTYKREGCTLCHDEKMLADAEHWYKSRVNPGTIEKYIKELSRFEKYPDRSNIETMIAPCDAATGYPRKWHN